MPSIQPVEDDLDGKTDLAARSVAISQSQTNEVNESNANKTNITTLQSRTPNELKDTEDTSNAKIPVEEEKEGVGSSNLTTASQEGISKPTGDEEAHESSKTLNQNMTDVVMEEDEAMSGHFRGAP